MPRNSPKGGGNPFMSGLKNHGRESESRVLSKVGAKERLNSGAVEGLKGDGDLAGKHGAFLIECKSTIHQSMGVKKAWLDKITNEALDETRIPALTVSYVKENGEAQDSRSDWVMIPRWLFEEHFG